jgi:hypothetical protein
MQHASSHVVNGRQSVSPVAELSLLHMPSLSLLLLLLLLLQLLLVHPCLLHLRLLELHAHWILGDCHD